MAWPFTNVGAPNFDTDFVAVPTNVAGNIPNSPGGAVTAWLLGAHFANPNAVAAFVTITDGNGHQIIPNIEVPANGVVAVDWEFMPVIGTLTWISSAAVTGKLWGYI